MASSSSSSLPSLFSLSGRTAVITGGTRGIGAAMTIALAEAGADIILIQRETTNKNTHDVVVSLGRKCTIYSCDLASQSSVTDLTPRILADGHDPSILVTSAGIQRRHPAELFPLDDFDEVLQVNLRSVFTLNRDLGAYMLTRPGAASMSTKGPPHRGSIVNVASIGTFQGIITIPAYVSAKGGVGQLTKALSNEWAGKGVNVNAIAPGYIETDLTEALVRDPVRSKSVLERIPVGRWGEPDDFKGVVVFLASRASSYVSGEIVTVDGGWMAR